MRDQGTVGDLAGPAAPSAWVARFLELMVPGGEVLDVACGRGRHLALGLASGRRMVGVDRDVSQVAVAAAGERLDLIEADLENGAPWPLAERTFDGVIVTNYLWRPLLPVIIGTAAGHGVLIYETFAVGQQRFGRPRNPEFLLRPGELLDAVRPLLEVVAYEHLQLTEPDRMVQRIVAIAPTHPKAAKVDA